MLELMAELNALHSELRQARRRRRTRPLNHLLPAGSPVHGADDRVTP